MRRWLGSPLWRKAPVALLWHRSALAAIVVAGFLVALAASSAPFVTTATASAELKNDLVGLSPLATGLQVRSLASGSGTLPQLVRDSDRREAGLSAAARRLGLAEPVFTLESSPDAPFSVATGAGDRVLLMARTDALRHVKVLSQVSGDGVWISDLTAHDSQVRPGGTLRLLDSSQTSTTSLALRVKGIYRALDGTVPGPYWANFLPEIVVQGADPPPPVRYVLMSRDELLRTAARLSTSHVQQLPGSTYRSPAGLQFVAHAEMAVPPAGLTLAHARSLARSFGLFRRRLVGSSLGAVLHCSGPKIFVGVDQPLQQRCTSSSSLSSAVALANRNASEISPGVSLLSAAGAAIALAVAGAAGVFLVRRRSAEVALLYARGEHPASFVSRTALELLLPTVLGAAAGFGVALALTGVFAPSGSIDGGTVSAALGRAALGAAVAIALAAGAAGVLFLRQFDSGTRRLGRLRWIPWELVPLGLGLWFLAEVLSGHGLARSGAQAAGHPTLVVFVMPLLLVAAVAGLAMRVVRPALRYRGARGAALPTPAFLALRRLSAARGVLTALFVVSAVAFGAYFYAQALAGSLDRDVTEKAYVAYGGDVQALSSGARLPRRFPYPLTSVTYGNQAATIGSAEGTAADVLAVDPGTIGKVLHWYPDWGPDPRAKLADLGGSGGGPLDAVVSGVPVGTRAVWLEGARIPIHVVAQVSTFPGMSPGVPLVVLSSQGVDAAARRLHLYELLGDPQTYLWAKGPPEQVSRALAAPAVGGYFASSVDTFSKDPDVLLARRTFSYMRLIAFAAGLLVGIGLLLYLQARQRSQAVGSALAARMGLRRRDEVLSLSLELALVAFAAAVVGGVVALAAAAPIVRHLDPLPDDAPPPVLSVPWLAIVGAAAALIVLAVVAGALTSRSARRTNMSEALRVA